MKTALCFASAALSLSSMAFAGNNKDHITMHMEFIDTPSDAFAMIDHLNVNINAETSFVAPEGADDISIDQIVNLGKKAWDVIVANQPVLDVKFQFANALPLGVKSSASLTDFSDLQHRSVRLYGTNYYGMTVYDVTMTAVHQYNGQYNGKGRYLETVAILPSNVSVLWGYTLNYSVDNISSLNGGTAADPIAKLSLNAKLRVETVFQKQEANTVYQFRGDSANVTTSGM